MAYEWNAQRAKRTRILRTAAIIAATIMSVGVPLCIVIAALTY